MVPVQFPGLILGDTGPLPAEALALAANPSKGRPGEGGAWGLGDRQEHGGRWHHTLFPQTGALYTSGLFYNSPVLPEVTLFLSS